MKLNLGCGGKKLDGFINVDLSGNWSGVEPDVIADITKRLPFDDETADEVHAYHVIEHIERFEVEEVLLDWIRVLKPGGLFVVECPCLEKILDNFYRSIKEKRPVDLRLTMWGLYGDPNYKNPKMMHRWCYARMELILLLGRLGIDVNEEPPQTHISIRDMRMVGVK